MNVQSSSIIDRYVAEIRRYPLLTREQEVTLAREAQAGRAESRDRLINGNLRFVVKVAGGYRGLGVPFEDLVNEGNLGLMEAVYRFDPSRGNRFISCAVCWIRRSILRALSQQSHTVRLPESQLRKMQQTRRTERALTQELGRRPTVAEIAKKLQRKPADVRPVHLQGLRLSSLDEPVGDDAPCGTIADLLPDEEHASAEERMIRRQATDNVSHLCRQLNDKERTVIRGRFGLDGDKPQTLDEIGQRLGFSREGVRLVERRALRRLADRFAAATYAAPRSANCVAS